MSFFGDKINNSIALLKIFLEAANTIKPTINVTELATELAGKIDVQVDLPQLDFSTIKPQIDNTNDILTNGTPDTSYFVQQLTAIINNCNNIKNYLPSLNYSMDLSRISAVGTNTFNSVKSQNELLVKINASFTEVTTHLNTLLSNLVPSVCNLYIRYSDACEAYANLYIHPDYAVVIFHKIIEHIPTIKDGTNDTQMYISDANLMTLIKETDNTYLDMPTNSQYIKFSPSNVLIVSDNTTVSNIIINQEYRLMFIKS